MSLCHCRWRSWIRFDSTSSQIMWQIKMFNPRNAAERCFVADLSSLQLEAQEYTKSWIATWKGDKVTFVHLWVTQNRMFLGCFSYNVTTVEMHFRNVTWAVFGKVAAKSKEYFIDLQNLWCPSKVKHWYKYGNRAWVEKMQKQRDQTERTPREWNTSVFLEKRRSWLILRGCSKIAK